MATFTGTTGSDILVGGTTDDTITGLGGADTLTGGGGADTFSDTAAGLAGDTVTDFSVGDRLLFTDLTATSGNLSLSGSVLSFAGGSVTLTGLGGGRLVVRNVVGGVEARLQHGAFNDFNGDGRSDILWRSDGGSLSDWLSTSTGGFVGNDANAFSQVPTSWKVVGTGDFNGDDKVDILWRNDTGALSDWLGKANGGFTANDAIAFSQVPTSWKVAGTGDFNGDGRFDILWRNDSGTLSDWLGQANGGFAANDAAAATFVPTSWTVAGTGDFNGDGRMDILWRNSDGTMSDWLGQPNGGFVANDAAAATRVPTDWKIAATGDFNGDGRDDILWRNDGGAISDWLGQANGGFAANDANAFSQVPTDWKIVATGDYNGDNRDDILWRNDGGALSDWLGQANGGFVGNDVNALSQVPTVWKVQPVHGLV